MYPSRFKLHIQSYCCVCLELQNTLNLIQPNSQTVRHCDDEKNFLHFPSTFHEYQAVELWVEGTLLPCEIQLMFMSPWAVCIYNNDKIMKMENNSHWWIISPNKHFMLQLLLLLISFSVFAILFIHSEGFLFLIPAFCSSTRKMKKRSRVKTLFLISIVNFSRHPRFWVFFCFYENFQL